MKSKNYKILAILILFLCFFSFAIGYYYDYQFNQILKESAKIPASSWDEKYKDMPIKDKYKVAFVTNDGGELSYVEYFKIAAEKKGWEVKIYNYSTKGKEREIVEFDPDFMILTNYVKLGNTLFLKAHRSKKFLLNFLSLQRYREDHKKDDAAASPYDLGMTMNKLMGLCHGVLTISEEISYYQKFFKNRGKPTFDGFRIFPVVQEIQNEPAEPKNIMWGGVGSDSWRYSEKYKKFIARLSENAPMKVYGPYRNFSYLAPHIYDGYIMFGMNNINKIRENGIYLLTHGQFHFEANIPGLRIFEAVAANAIVISDKLPFAIEHFGDSFLYFDQNADSETMYQQVKAHYDWIKANPEKAKAMAAKAHKIFLEKFTLEKDLDRIARMYEYLVKKDKDDGLSCPFVF